jgi:tetratricopeptide (TPR) repeat protein
MGAAARNRHAMSHGGDADHRDRSGPGLLELLVCFAAALAAQLPLLRQLHWIDPGGADAGRHLWPGLATWLTTLPQSPRAIVLLRSLLAAGLALAGLLVARIVARGGAGRPTAAAAGLLAPLWPGSAGFLLDGSGVGLLIGWLALLFMVDRRLVAAERRPGDRIAAIASGALAIYASQGALLPFVVFAVVAATADSMRRVVSSLAAGLASAALLLWLQVTARAHVGFGFGLGESLGPVRDVASGIDAFVAATTLGFREGAGLLLPPPFVDAGEQGGAARLGLLAAVALAVTALALFVRQRDAARRPFASRMPLPHFALGLGGLWLAPATLGLVAAGRAVSVAPTALLPAAGGVLTFALVGPLRATFQRSRRYGPIAPFVVPLAAVVFAAAQPQRHANDPAAEFAAQRGAWCAVREFERSHDVDEFAQRVLDGASPATPRLPWPEATLERAALSVAAAYEDRGDREVALAFLERFLAQFAARGGRGPARVRGERLGLLLKRLSAEAAAAKLNDELAAGGDDPDWVAAVAEPLVDALERSASDPNYVAAVLPLVERLLESTASHPEAAGAAELECLALVRAGQRRLVDAVRLAERAIEVSPRSARPHLILARIYLSLDQREAGVKEVARARAIDPDDPASQFLEGRLLCPNADFAELGVTRMLAALKTAPALPGVREDFDEAMARATTALLGREQVSLARTLLARALAQMGRRPALVHELGRIAQSRREFDAAVEAFEEASAAAPDRADWKRDLCEALRDSGYALLVAQKREEAVARFERALAVAPPDFETGGMKLVVESFKRENDPELAAKAAAARAAFDAAAKLYASGDKEGAKRGFEDSLRLLPLNPLAHLDLGKIELELGDAKSAEARLRTAIAVGRAINLPAEEAYPLLLQALSKQEGSDPKIVEKVGAVADEYLRLFPEGRFREVAQKARGR